MKKVLPILLLLISGSVSKAQNSWGILSLEDYATIKIINDQYSQSMSLTDIDKQPINGNWSQLNLLGVGLPACSTNEYTGTECYIRKPGIEIYYSNQLGGFMMGKLTITNINFGFKIKGQLIKIGDDVSKLLSVHSDAYSKRQKVRSRTIDDHQVLLHLAETGVAISFRYDPQTNCITMIRVSQSIV